MKTLQLDIVSDVSCPWCIIGYKGLEQALAELPDIDAIIHWHPFELNPQMPPEGQEIVEHITQKYGITEQQSQQNRQQIMQRAEAVGFPFTQRAERIYNTFDAHRLLHWAGLHEGQTALKLALFRLYFQRGGNPSDHQQLLDAVAEAGLDVAAAQQVLDSDQYASDVRQAEQQVQQQGIQSVPAVIVNRQYLISGGQPADVFKQALQDISDKP